MNYFHDEKGLENSFTPLQVNLLPFGAMTYKILVKPNLTKGTTALQKSATLNTYNNYCGTDSLEVYSCSSLQKLK